MFGRKKTRASPARGPSSGGLRPGREETARVLRAFIVAPPSGPSDFNPAVPGPRPRLVTTASPAAGAPSPFVFNISEFVGPENAQPVPSGAGQDRVIDFPGIGPVTTGQLHRASQRVEQVLEQISGGADLFRDATPAVLMGALERLDSMHAQGDVTDEQYEALVAAAASLTK